MAKDLFVDCSCKSEFQDKEYGTGVRVVTLTQRYDAISGKADVKCTVCGKTHTINVKNQKSYRK
jgi:hypothetical protein